MTTPEHDLLATAMTDEPPFAPAALATRSIRAGRSHRRRRRLATGAGVMSLALVAGGFGYSAWGRPDFTTTVPANSATSRQTSPSKDMPGQPLAAKNVLKQLLEARGLQLSSEHGFTESPNGDSTTPARIRGGFNTADGASVDVQITVPGPARCADTCQKLPDGRSYRVGIEPVLNTPSHAVTTAVVYESDGRVVSVSMRTYPLTAGGQAELDAPASPYPLGTQQLLELAAATIWAQVLVN